MNKNLLSRIFILMLALMLACCPALAEQVTVECEIGALCFQLEQSHIDMGMTAEAGSDADGRLLCLLTYSYLPAMAELQSQLMEALNSSDQAALEQVLTEAQNHMYILSGCTLLPQEEYAAALEAGTSLTELAPHADPATLEIFGENDGYVYLTYQMPSLADSAFEGKAEEEKQQYLECYAAAVDAIAAAELIPVTMDSTSEYAYDLPEVFPDFSTKNLNGETVTQDLFTGKKLTIVNVWGTFCGPCISEMPELGQWSQELPEGVQLVGLLCDVYSYEDTEQVQAAQRIVEETGADFPHLIGDSSLDSLLMCINAVPTTLFVDGEGNLVGEPVIGANVAAYKAFVESYLNQP